MERKKRLGTKLWAALWIFNAHEYASRINAERQSNSRTRRTRSWLFSFFSFFNTQQGQKDSLCFGYKTIIISSRARQSLFIFKYQSGNVRIVTHNDCSVQAANIHRYFSSLKMEIGFLFYVTFMEGVSSASAL